MFVNKAGFAIARVRTIGPALHGAVVFPEQVHAVSELAGEYNTLAFDRTVANGPVHMTSSTLSINAAGTLTALNFCDDLSRGVCGHALVRSSRRARQRSSGHPDFLR